MKNAFQKNVTHFGYILNPLQLLLFFFLLESITTEIHMTQSGIDVQLNFVHPNKSKEFQIHRSKHNLRECKGIHRYDIHVMVIFVVSTSQKIVHTALLVRILVKW